MLALHSPLSLERQREAARAHPGRNARTTRPHNVGARRAGRPATQRGGKGPEPVRGTRGERGGECAWASERTLAVLLTPLPRPPSQQTTAAPPWPPPSPTWPTRRPRPACPPSRPTRKRRTCWRPPRRTRARCGACWRGWSQPRRRARWWWREGVEGWEGRWRARCGRWWRVQERVVVVQGWARRPGRPAGPAPGEAGREREMVGGRASVRLCSLHIYVRERLFRWSFFCLQYSQHGWRRRARVHVPLARGRRNVNTGG